MASLEAATSRCEGWPARRNRTLAVVIALTTTAACGWPFGGPSEWAAGNWEAVAAGNTHLFRLALEQSGDRVAGRACALDISTPSQPAIEFLDVAVSGQYPEVRFTTSSGAGFSGRYDKERDVITGDFGPAAVHATPLRFTRIPNGRCVL